MVTKRQKEILDFIASFIDQNRHSPSYREIQSYFGFSSLGSVYNHIQTLKQKGILAEKKGARSLALQEKRELNSTELPLVGKLQGGMPIEFFPHFEMRALSFPQLCDEKDLYLLQVEGHGLIEEQMQDQDLLLVQPRTDFEDGELVIASVENHTTFVKRAYFDPPYLRFESTNPYVQPLILREEHVKIQGIILYLFRNFSSAY